MDIQMKWTEDLVGAEEVLQAEEMIEVVVVAGQGIRGAVVLLTDAQIGTEDIGADQGVTHTLDQGRVRIVVVGIIEEEGIMMMIVVGDMMMKGAEGHHVDTGQKSVKISRTSK